MWKITKDPVYYKSHVFASADWNKKEAKKLASKGNLWEFRMLAPMNEYISMYYYGVTTIPKDDAPLMDFGLAIGCDYIEYRDKEGIWRF